MPEHSEQSTSIPGLVHGQLCYLQLPADDITPSARFYERLFGWRVDPPESGFEAPSLIGQWITDRSPSPDGGPVAWILVQEIRRTLQEAEQEGATVRDGPRADGPRWLASFTDPGGNLIGIAQHGDGPAADGARGHAAKNRTMPPATVMPVLVYDDVPAAIGWLCAAFDFTERWRVAEHRAVLEFDGGAVMLGDSGEAAAGQAGPAAPSTAPGTDHGVMVRVDDLDVHCERARRHGARVTGGPREYSYGERQYNALDIGGHGWTFSQSIFDVAPEDWGGSSGPALGD